MSLVVHGGRVQYAGSHCGIPAIPRRHVSILLAPQWSLLTFVSVEEEGEYEEEVAAEEEQ